MSRRSRRSRPPAARWRRRGRRLLVLGLVVGVLAGVRSVVLGRDQRAFDARYGAGGA